MSLTGEPEGPPPSYSTAYSQPAPPMGYSQQYPQQNPPQGYPPQQYPPPQYPPQQYPPAQQYPPQQCPPAQQYPPQQYPDPATVQFPQSQYPGPCNPQQNCAPYPGVPSAPRNMEGETDPEKVGRPWNPYYDPAIERNPQRQKRNRILRILSLAATLGIIAVFLLNQFKIGRGLWLIMIIPFVGIHIAYKVCSTPDERWWSQHAYFILYYLVTDKEHALLYAKWERHEW